MPKHGELKKTASKRSKQQRAYNSTPKQKKRRAERNASRAKMKKKVGAKAIKGRDVDHKDKNTSNKSSSNLRLKSKKANRADNRGKGGRKKKK